MPVSRLSKKADPVISNEDGDCYGTFKKLIRDSVYSKSDYFKKLSVIPKSLFTVATKLRTVFLTLSKFRNMQFNANKTEEVNFSCERQKPNHPNFRLGNDSIASKNEHKHLGLILDSKLDFQSHNRGYPKSTQRDWYDKCLSKYVCREVLEQIFKLYVRPHLDYGDIIYHKHDPNMHLHFTQKLEQTQYSAVLAVTGAWRGTSRQKLYNELGWETLYHRRWYRILCHFYSLCKSKVPDYLYSEIPQQRNLVYNLRNPH